MGKQSVVLEHRVDGALVRWQGADFFAVEVNRAGRGAFKACATR